jgi:DNA-binding IclR family transcriptional regulator
MNSWIIVIVVVGLVIVFLLTYRKTREPVVGICAAALDQTVRKNANKAKVLELLQEKEMTNTDIRDALGVSRNTAVRYMDELEAEGRVEQVGTTGRSVLYRAR